MVSRVGALLLFSLLSPVFLLPSIHITAIVFCQHRLVIAFMSFGIKLPP